MKKPVIDYRNLRLSNIRSGEYRHLLLLLSWPLYLLLYCLSENLISYERCRVMHCRLDDLIPFCELFILPYLGWFVLIFLSLAYFLFYDPENFSRLQKFIILTQVVCMTVYILFPNRQDLRPEVFPRDNLLTRIVGIIYSLDTSTGVCPSLHVAHSLGAAFAWCREPSASRRTKALITAFALLICISVSFVKQHSVLDILAAVPLSFLIGWIVFRNRDQ